MIDRFQGERGHALLVEAMATSKMLVGDMELAAEMANRGQLISVAVGEELIGQGADTNDVFYIISGVCDVLVNGRRVAMRGPSDHVGEMAAIQPTQSRSATVIATEPVIAVKLAEPIFTDIASRNPKLYRAIAQELSRRLLQRNKSIGAFRTKVRVFIICSVEALPIARAIENALEYDPFTVEIWNEGCFKVANYTIKSLEEAVDQADFAIAIAHADDEIKSREKTWPATRDNVIFELGLFMGRLGLERAILMEPRGKDIKLPSDLAGVTTIAYRFQKGEDAASLMGPACNKLRDHIQRLGPDNG